MTRRLASALVAAFLGTTLLLAVDYLRLDPDVQTEGSRAWLAILGLVSCLVLVLAPLKALVDRLGARSPFLGTLVFGPALFWLVEISLAGGWARQFRRGFWTALLASFVLVLLLHQGRRVLKRAEGVVGRFGMALMLLALAAACHEVDRRVYVGLYPLQHAFCGLLAAYAATAGILLILPRRGSGRIALGLLLIVSVLAPLHLLRFYSDPMPVRRLVAGQDGLVATRSIRRLLPYLRREEERPLAADFSSSFQAARERRREALERFHAERPARKYDLIVISVDAIGVRHTSLHDQANDITPFLREFAADCLDFEGARSSSTASFFSLTAMLSGAYPSTISLLRGKDPQYLSEGLEAAGYRTIGYYTDAVFTARPPQWTPPDQRLGFQEFRLSHEYATELLDMLSGVVEEQTGPYFLFTHIMDPHSPYETREGFDFGEDSIDRYHSELAHVDAELRRFVEGLKRAGRYDDTIIVITSDHGEAFGEHGHLLHGGVPYEEQCHVPLLIRVPGIPGRRIPGPVSQTALAPTLLDILGLPDLQASESRSLLPLILDMVPTSEQFAVVERPTLFDAATWPSTTALIQGRWKTLHDHDAGVVQLFDLAGDPGERQDLSAREPERLKELLELEETWRSDRRLLRARTCDIPLDLLQARERLRDGHAEAAEVLAAFLASDDARLRLEAGLGFHDAILNGTLNDEVLAAAAESSGDIDLKSLLDLIRSAEERRPWRGETSLLESEDHRLRRRAAASLWRMREEAFTVELARERWKNEPDQEARADLLGVVLQHEPRAFELDAAQGLLGKLEGDVVGRLAFSLLSLDDEVLGDRLGKLVRHPDVRIVMSVVESLGAHDSPKRRELMRRFLRLSNVTLRRIAIRGLQNFPRSDWKRDILVDLVRREPHDEMRILAGIHAAEFPDEVVTEAFLDALALYPVTGLGFGHLLATGRAEALAAWDLRDQETRCELEVGLQIDLRPDIKGEMGRKRRRLLMTTIRTPGLEPQDDYLRVFDRQGTLLFEQKHVDQAVMYYLDLEIPVGPGPAPEYRIRIESERRPAGETFGDLFATLILAQDMAKVWPADQEDMSDVAILSRFSPGWECNLEDLDLVFLTADEGEIRMKGNQVGASTLELALVGGSEDQLVEFILNGRSIGRLQTKAGESHEIEIGDIRSIYDARHLNRLTLRATGLGARVDPVRSPERGLGLRKVTWR